MEMQNFIKAKPVVGQEVYVAKYNQRLRQYSDGEYRKVSKVGRKYFEVEGVTQGKTPMQFFMDSKKANSEYSGSPALYPSKEYFEQERLFNKTKAAVVELMREYNALNKLDYSELKAIADILSKKYDINI